MSTAAPSPVRRSRRLAGSKNEAARPTASAPTAPTAPTTAKIPAESSHTTSLRTDEDAAIVGLADSVEIAGFKPPRFLWSVIGRWPSPTTRSMAAVGIAAGC